MSSPAIAIINLEEMIADFRNYLREDCGQSEMAAQFPDHFLVQELEYLARVAVNRNHLNVHPRLRRTRHIFKMFDPTFSKDQINEWADEMYMRVREELPTRIAEAGHIFQTQAVGKTLYIRLLVSADAFGYGIDPHSIIDAVI
jgi:predicted SAM-dependent methyltransferase